MRPMLNKREDLLKINHQDLTIRVSIDHYQKEKHEEIRGKNTFNVMMEGLKWLNQNNFNNIKVSHNSIKCYSNPDNKQYF